MKKRLKEFFLFLKTQWISVTVSIVLMLLVAAITFVLTFAEERANVRLGDNAINQLEYSDRYIATKNIYASLGYEVDNNKELTNYIKTVIINKMIEEEYGKMVAKELNVNISNSEVEKFIKDSGYTETIYSKDLSYIMAKGDYLKLVNQYALAAKLINSEEKLQNYYNANQDKFMSTRTKNTEQLIFKDKETADIVYDEIKKGKPLSEFEGDEIIYIETAVSESDTKLSQFISSLGENEMSEVTPFGGNYFIIKSKTADFVGTVIPFEEAKDQIVTEILNTEGTEFYEKLVLELLKDNELTVK